MSNPTTNLEYGYLAATLTRRRVALCHYAGAELPSDFAGLTYISMGTLEPAKPLNDQAKERLKSWATELPAIQFGFSPTCQMHGYSGLWKIETAYEVYRHIQIKEPDYVVFRGNLILQIPADGKIRNAMQSQQRIRLEGDPPQRDGFEPDFRGAREIDLFFHCPPDEPGVLHGRYASEVGGNIYSKATGKWSR